MVGREVAGRFAFRLAGVMGVFNPMLETGLGMFVTFPVGGLLGVTRLLVFERI